MAKKSKFLTRSAILEADDLPIEECDVPEWGGAVHVRGLRGDERDAFERSLLSADGKTVIAKNVRARLVHLCCVDENGERIFDNPDDLKALAKKSAAALDRIFSVAQRLSGMSAQDVEDMAKNSETGQSEDSSLD